MIKRLFASIQNQLVINAIAPVVFVIVLVTSFMLMDSLDGLEERTATRGNDLVQQVSAMSEFFFFAGDTDKLEDVAELMIKTDGMVSITFYDSERRLLLERTNVAQGSVNRYEVPIFSKPTELDDFATITDDSTKAELLGYVKIGLSNSAADEQRVKIYLRVLIIAILGTIFGTILAFISSRHITRSLSTMMQAARGIKAKQFAARSAENGHGELLEFQRSFNEMASALEQNEKDLQQRISRATQSLNITVSELSKRNQELAAQRQETIELERSKAISDERTRIMKDMHDGIGGQLVASIAMIEREKETEVGRNIATILKECLDDFRLIINSLNVSANDLSALLADFKYRNQRKLALAGIALNWRVDSCADDINLQPQQSLHVLRILQELFTNIYKHAGASEIDFSVYQDGDNIVIKVADNGRFSGCGDGVGHGIKNMQWRANELGGEMVFSRSEVGGCQALLKAPLAR
ncbi:HAMP domain-containing protein [Neptunomonas sp. XY-337]|uniref:sensor histidine kinase n=1 Tax=Neptunomonas sp. XY-337 TaxID=2561897 RepID=UPI0010A9D913|nr:HAMP domain-containing protein [Neptunomonas sp. XY-337]